MRRLLIVCVGMVLVYGGSAFGGEPKWVCDSKVTLPEWARGLSGERRARVRISDFSLVDGAILGVLGPTLWVEVERADGSVSEVRSVGFAEGLTTVPMCSLFERYYLQPGYSAPPGLKSVVVKADGDALIAHETPPSAWLLRQRLRSPAGAQWDAQEQLSPLQVVRELFPPGEPSPPSDEEMGRRLSLVGERLASALPPRTLVFHFTGSLWASTVYARPYATAEGRLIAVVGQGARIFVVCFDIYSGEMEWSRHIAGLTGRYSCGTPRILGGVVNLVLYDGGETGGPDDRYVALDLETGRLLRERPVPGAAPRFLREEGGSRLLRVHAGNAFETGGVTLLEEDANEEVWAVRPPGWRRFGLGLVQSEGQVFVPFTKELTPIVERWARESNKPWLPEARKDPVTHGVMCYRASDGSLEATYGLDYGHLPGAPRRGAPDFVFWQGRDTVSPGSPPIVTHDLVILPPVRLVWNRDWACAVAVFSRVSGELLDILWTNVVRRDGGGGTQRLKMELDGNDLFFLTRDGRLWCFELPLPPQP